MTAIQTIDKTPRAQTLEELMASFGDELDSREIRILMIFLRERERQLEVATVREMKWDKLNSFRDAKVVSAKSTGISAHEPYARVAGYVIVIGASALAASGKISSTVFEGFKTVGQIGGVYGELQSQHNQAGTTKAEADATGQQTTLDDYRSLTEAALRRMKGLDDQLAQMEQAEHQTFRSTAQAG